MQVGELLTLLIAAGSIVGACVYNAATTRSLAEELKRNSDRTDDRLDDLEGRVNADGQTLARLSALIEPKH